MDKILFGERIREYRKQKGLTIHQLAEMTDISDVFMGTIEHGQKLPSLETFLRVVNALDISADVLLQEDVRHGTQFAVDELTRAIHLLDDKQQRLACKIMNSVVEALKKN